MKGVVDPAVGLVQQTGDIERLSDVSDIPRGNIKDWVLDHHLVAKIDGKSYDNSLEAQRG